jgi:hypothetical protein
MEKRKSSFLIATCEEKSANAKQLTFNKTFRQVTFDWLLLQLWGDLIADAPSAVTVLEKLIVVCIVVFIFWQIRIHKVLPEEFPNHFTSNWSSILFGLAQCSR